MRHLIQFHSYDRELLPMDTWENYPRRIYCRQPPLQDEISSRVFLIAGIGSPQRYYLWTSFVIDEVQITAPGIFSASGKGWDLNPPQRLQGKDFNRFRESCADFVAVRRVDDLPFTKRLKSLADEFHREKFTKNTLAFCTELMELIPEDQDATRLRAFVHEQLGDFKSAIQDLERAAACLARADDQEFADDTLEWADEIRSRIPIEVQQPKGPATVKFRRQKRPV
jgi:hypothetical protein